MADENNESESLLDAVLKLSGQVAGGTLDIARNTATMSAMFGETWLRNTLLNKFEPESLEAMAEAGHFLRDARETAGLSIKDLADSIDLSDRSVLEDIESGQTIMSLELMLRSAALLARHDPIPFLIKFMRTYNPALEKALEQWGVLALPKQYERERRFVNLMRQHDALRGMSDEEYDRFIQYMESSSNLVLDVMHKEKRANSSRVKASSNVSPGGPKTKSQSKPKPKTPRKKAVPKARKRAPGRQQHKT